MTTAALSKGELRDRSAQLRALLCKWDPIGVMGDPDWPRDKYDCLVGPLLTLLAPEASEEEIARYLRNEIEEHFGLPARDYDFTAVAERVRRWFDRGWRSLAEPVTIFVALLDEGINFRRPVQARPLDHGLFRILAIEAGTSDEKWQFPVGAVAKCEYKQFADGKRGMTAVEQVEVAD
jgi:hypothetical protein